MKNTYVVDGKISCIQIIRLNGEVMEVPISTGSLARVKEFPGTWGLSINNSTGSFYVTAKHQGKTIHLHRWIMQPGPGLVVDHINNDTMDNRLENLRMCKQYENGQNRKSRNKNNVSGASGVSWYKAGQKWRAYITPNGKQIHLGYFEEKAQAERAVIEAKKTHMPYSKEAMAR